MISKSPVSLINRRILAVNKPRSEERPLRKILAIVFVATLILYFVSTSQAQNTPDRLSDDAFWKLSADLSEPDGAFQSENLLSNETDFPHVMAQLERSRNRKACISGSGPNRISTTSPPSVQGWL